MTESLFDSCDDSCGWVAAAVATLCYGTYAVPIKSLDFEVDPLVFQSYKTGTMFLVCWLVTTVGVSVMWTPWGILSGLLWVLGGCGGVIAVRAAGMATAVGTWASVMIVVNFIWGILVFREPVADFWGTVGAFSMLGLGLKGMSYYSAPPDEPPATGDSASEPRRNQQSDSGESGYLEMQDTENVQMEATPQETVSTDAPSDFVVLFGAKMTRRRVGILGAIFNGVTTGSSLVPLHYAKQRGFGGANYVISFSCGAMLANTLLWAIYFLQRWVTLSASGTPGSSVYQAYSSLPSWHIGKLWFPGVSAGLLLATAMFSSILSTTYLGQGVGNSLVQSKILISGLWGIFWYREITGWDRISKWFVAAFVTVCGILWLSYERMAATGEDSSHRSLANDQREWSIYSLFT